MRPSGWGSLAVMEMERLEGRRYVGETLGLYKKF
jgi:hypothetical protein